MMIRSLAVLFVLVWAVPAAGTEATDVVTLKDGSVLYGEVVEMTEGELKLKALFGVDQYVKVKWAEVSELAISRPLPFHLAEGTVLVGTVQEVRDGVLWLKVDPLLDTVPITFESVTSINPLVLPPVVYQGALTLGFSQTTGNANLRNASFLGDFTGKSESLRLTLWARYIYGDDQGNLIVRNSRGTIKLDFFASKRLYWFTAAYFEQDTFQDLNLRTSLSSGPGYQLIDKGDLRGRFVKEMTLYAEAGLAYFNEDFKIAQDQTTIRSRVSIKWNWPILDEKIMIYHFDELFPSVQNTADFYLTSDQGIRLKIYEGFVSGFQVTYRYNNKPPPGIKSADVMYLFTLGYSFNTSPKR